MNIQHPPSPTGPRGRPDYPPSTPDTVRFRPGQSKSVQVSPTKKRPSRRVLLGLWFLEFGAWILEFSPQLADHMTKHRVPEFRFKPRALGRHDPARVRNRHQ